jgi:uncharacterized protein YodC (DUF2158 family)
MDGDDRIPVKDPPPSALPTIFGLVKTRLSDGSLNTKEERNYKEILYRLAEADCTLMSVVALLTEADAKLLFGPSSDEPALKGEQRPPYWCRGAIVKLKSGGPWMTVEATLSEREYETVSHYTVRCTWFRKDRLFTETFDSESLEAIGPLRRMYGPTFV